VAGPVYEFGAFRLDCGRFLLLRNGRSIRVARKPLELLILLVSHDGDLVTRAEIARCLWSSEVFVDTEHGINTAVRTIRQLLRDAPDNPHFIQTVTGMGYRFIAPVSATQLRVEDNQPVVPPTVPEGLEPAPSTSAVPASMRDPASAETPRLPLAGKVRLGLWLAAFIVLVLAILATVGPRPLVARLFHRNTPPTITSLAVLPLDNLSGDPGQEYFAEGMTDELTTMLAKNSSLLITSRTSVMQYKAARRPLPEIAKALKVDAILEGTVSRTGNQVHMTLQLIRADTDTHLWAESYDCNPNEVAALPGVAARNIATRLHRAIVSSSSASSVSPEAYDAYLRGRYFLQKREADKSAAYFQRAISIDPSWSEAYAGLAAALVSEGFFAILRPDDAITKGEAAARRAIELDPQDGEAYSALGLIQCVFEWKWKDAEGNLKRGIALSPSSAQAEQYYAIYLDSVNRPEEAVAHARRALELDPQSFWTNRYLGSALYTARHYDEALAHLEQALEMEPGKVGSVAGWASKIYEMKGMRDKAVESDALDVQSEAPEVNIDSMRALYKRDGWKAYWDARMKMMLARKNDLCAPYDIGLNYIRLGKPALSFSRLNAAIDQKCWKVGVIMVDPMVDGIRSDKRYNDLLKRMNLPY
jgi:TolB-like protein/DNA-binding winged helix-turn-helix (wHTH) protein/Tfp pilus assembly protein PilF